MNRFRSPVASSVRLSLTRGAATSMAPAAVTTVRGRAFPLRTTAARPSAPRSARAPSTYIATSASSAAMSMLRAPSRTISSSAAARSSRAASSGAILTTIGVLFPAGPLHAGVALDQAREGYAASITESRIHNFCSYLHLWNLYHLSKSGDRAPIATAANKDCHEGPHQAADGADPEGSDEARCGWQSRRPDDVGA